MVTVQVDLIGSVYTSHLTIHYFRLNPPGTHSTLICTSSIAGRYAAEPIPVCTAAKYGIVGLVRSLTRFFEAENVMIHTVRPGGVPTNIVDPESMKDFLKAHFTSVQNVVDCVEALLFRRGMFANAKRGKSSGSE